MKDDAPRIAVELLGLILVIVGLWLVWIPLAFVAAGIGLVALANVHAGDEDDGNPSQ